MLRKPDGRWLAPAYAGARAVKKYVGAALVDAEWLRTGRRRTVR
jgi:hypothetical protein